MIGVAGELQLQLLLKPNMLQASTTQPPNKEKKNQTKNLQGKTLIYLILNMIKTSCCVIDEYYVNENFLPSKNTATVNIFPNPLWVLIENRLFVFDKPTDSSSYEKNFQQLGGFNNCLINPNSVLPHPFQKTQKKQGSILNLSYG